jgi:Parvulin-like peptidyl-prolyl isomerase
VKRIFPLFLSLFFLLMPMGRLAAGDAPMPPETSLDPFRSGSRPVQPNARVTVALPTQRGTASIRDTGSSSAAAPQVYYGSSQTQSTVYAASGTTGDSAEPDSVESSVKTLARIENREITDRDVMRELWERKGRETFDWMVGKAILENELEKLGLAVTEKEISDRLDEHMRGLSLIFPKLTGRDELARAASGMGLDEYVERSVWAELALRKVMQASLKPTEEQLRVFYAECQADYIEPDRVRISQIFIAPPAGPDGDAEYSREGWVEAEKLALEAHTRLRMGEDFRDVAGSFASGSTTSRWVERGALMRELEDAAFSLRTGAMSAPIRTGMGYHIVRVEERRERKLPRFEDVREKVLADYEDKFFFAAAGDFMTRLKEKAIRDGKLVFPDTPDFGKE